MSLEMCPCKSKLPYQNCCEIFLNGNHSPKTALELMRSRYTAYAKYDFDYLVKTTHKDSLSVNYRKELLSTIDRYVWVGLEILKTSFGDESDTRGKVKFTATYIEDGVKSVLNEHSRFRKIKNSWYYYDGNG